MSLVMQCDRCKSIFTTDKDLKIRFVIVERRPFKQDVRYDMCDDCEKKLVEFLDNKSEE